MIAIAFWICLCAVVLAAFLLGGRTERQVATAYAVAAIASELMRSALTERYHHLEVGVFGVDAILLATLFLVSLRSHQWWPLCATALQTVTVLGHIAKLLDPRIWPLAYAWMMQASSFPSLAILAIAIVTHRRRARPSEPHGSRRS